MILVLGGVREEMERNRYQRCQGKKEMNWCQRVSLKVRRGTGTRGVMVEKESNGTGVHGRERKELISGGSYVIKYAARTVVPRKGK